jgi:trigger factor
MTVETDIKITKASEEPGATSLKVEVPVERVHAAETKAASQYAKRAKLPGFRAGKAPMALIRKRYREAIRESVLRDVIGASWQAAMDQEGLQPITDPRVKDLKFEDGAPITFELMVEVKPELKLERLGGFQLTRRVRRVTDEMVEGQIDELRRDRGPWVPADRERPEMGDLVSVSITPLEEGTAEESRDYQLVLGQGQAIPDLEERIMTLSRGETVDATVRFPDDYPDETKRTQARSVRVMLSEIKTQQLPDLTEDFARELGDFDSVEALRAAVRSDLEADGRREADAELRGQLVDQIVEANDIQAPRPMVQRALSAFAQAYEVPDDQLQQFATEFGPIAERQVKRDLIIDHVARAHDLKATEEEIDRRVEEIAKRRKAKPGEVYASLQKAGRLPELERNTTEEKVFSFLLEQSIVKDQ